MGPRELILDVLCPDVRDRICNSYEQRFCGSWAPHRTGLPQLCPDNHCQQRRNDRPSEGQHGAQSFKPV